jgi:chaperonin GroEL (HSP60 family)
MSLAVEEIAKTTKGKEALAIEAFAKALRALPTIICDNAGYDSAELVQNLRSELANGNTTSGKPKFQISHTNFLIFKFDFEHEKLTVWFRFEHG